MQHGVTGKLDGHLEHSWGLIYKALLVTAAVFAALIVSWIVYMVLVAAVILWAR